MKKYKLLMFDFDNTLINYSRIEKEALRFIFDKYFYQSTEYNEFINLFKIINLNLWSDYRANKIGIDQLRIRRFSMLIREFNSDFNSFNISQDYEDLLGNKVYVFEEVEKSLKELKKDFKLFIVTNGIASVQNKKLALSKLSDCIDFMVISEDIGFRKPDSEFFDYTLHKANVKRQKALMIGDSLNSDLLGAHNAKIDFCWINRSNRVLPDKFPKPNLIIFNLLDLINKLHI